MAVMPTGPITRVVGRAIPMPGDDIDTDRIMPARFLRVLTFEGLGEHVFEDDRRACAGGASSHPFDDPRFRGASILLAGRNFGCGSSREHAPQGLLRHGIRAIVGESFSEIFFGNAAALGMPCVSADRRAIADLVVLVNGEPTAEVAVDLAAMRVKAGRIDVPIALPGGVRDAFLSGAWDGTGLLLERFDEVRRLAGRLPYITGF